MRTLRTLLLFATGALCAQTSPDLIGIGRVAPGPLGVSLHRLDLATCSTTRCATTLNGILDRRLGGTAYDAVRGGAWITDGALLACVDPATCRVLCAPHPAPGLPSGEGLSGLAVHEPSGRMFAVTATGTLLVYRLDCPVVTLMASCRITLPRTHTVGGLCCDDVADLLFYAASDFTASSPANVVYVAPIQNPCLPACKLPADGCGLNQLGALTGVAFDACKSLIWVTDGWQTLGVLYSPAVCAARELRCCVLPAAHDPLQGLALLPSRPVVSGKSCTLAPCASCTALAHVAAGDPTLGNPAFGLVLQNAPANASAWLFLGAGPALPPGLSIPPFCGPLLVPLQPPPWMLAAPTGGGAACGGRAVFTFGVPAAPSLCGAQLSSQWLGLCPGLGTFVSNALSWEISTS